MSGFFTSIARGVGALLAGSQRALAGWADEFQRERHRLVGLIVWAGAALAAGGMGILLATAWILAVVPAGARVSVLAGLACTYLAASCILGVILRRRLARQPLRFPATESLLGIGQLLSAAAQMAGAKTHDPPPPPTA